MGDSMSSRLSEGTVDRLAMGEPQGQVDIQKGAAFLALRPRGLL